MEATWFFPALLTAFLYGAQSVYLKGILSGADKLLVAWSIFAFGLPLYLVFLGFSGIPAVTADFWWAFGISLGINALAWPLFVRAIQLSDISLVMPLVAFTPVFILGVEYVLLGAVPEGLGLWGILLIVVGAYVLNLQPGAFGIFDPIRSLAKDRGALYMLVVAAIWSVSATVEKVAVVSSSPAFYLTWLSAGFALVIAPVIFWRVDEPLSKLRGQAWPLIGVGALTGLMSIAQMYAIHNTPLVNYVISIKRAGMLVSVLVGWLVFRETNIAFRALGATLMIVGVVLIRMV